MLGRVSQFVSTFCQLKPMKLQGGTDMERGGGEEKKTQSVSREMGPGVSPHPQFLSSLKVTVGLESRERAILSS